MAGDVDEAEVLHHLDVLQVSVPDIACIDDQVGKLPLREVAVASPCEEEARDSILVLRLVVMPWTLIPLSPASSLLFSLDRPDVVVALTLELMGPFQLKKCLDQEIALV